MTYRLLARTGRRVVEVENPGYKPVSPYRFGIYSYAIRLNGITETRVDHVSYAIEYAVNLRNGLFPEIPF